MGLREGMSTLWRAIEGGASVPQPKAVVSALTPDLMALRDRLAAIETAEEPDEYIEFAVVEQLPVLPALRPALADSVSQVAEWMIKRAGNLYEDMEAGELDPDQYPYHWLQAVANLATIDDPSVPSYGLGDRQGRIY